MEGWFEKPQAKFVFQLKLYTESILASKDPKIIHMMFIQVRKKKKNYTIYYYPIGKKLLV